MDSFGRLGANRSHSRSYGEDLQRRMADEDAISCKRFGETQYQDNAVGSSDAASQGTLRAGLRSSPAPSVHGQ